MAAKKIHFREQAREKIRKGIMTLAEAVKTTLGPKGRNVIIEKSYGPPHITKDGVTVAKEIELEDKDENLGAQMVKEVASKTADKAGDGTTTATVLAEAIYLEGLRNVAAGANPTILKRGMDKAVEMANSELTRMSQQIRDQNEIEQVACISANNDAEIGKLIAKAMQSVGKDGRITVEDAKKFETDVHIVKGMNFDRGYQSAYFITNPETQECILEDCFVLIHEAKISVVKDMIPILQAVAEMGKPLLIIAEDIEGEALTTLVINRLRAGLKICAVKAPGFGDRRKAMLQDIAILTGAQVISEELGLKLETTSVEMLGRVKKAIMNKDETTLVDGAGKKTDIDARAAQIRQQIADSESDYDREKLEERLSKLTGGVAVIRVGAATEIEAKEKKDRIEDAQHATRAAVEEGVIPGGGTAYVRCIPALKKMAESCTGDEKTGIEIIIRSLSSPLRQIAVNAGYEGAIVLQQVESLPPTFGFNALTGEYVDMIEAGILDPKKVARLALQNAASIATLLLTTEATVTEIEDAKPAAAAAHGMGAGMDY